MYISASDERIYLSEERLVELEVLLLDVVEAVVAVGDEHDGERDELEQRAGVDDDAHQREDERFDDAADTLGQHEQQRVERRDAERRRAAVRHEVTHARLTATQPRELRRRHRRTAPVAQPARTPQINEQPAGAGQVWLSLKAETKGSDRKIYTFNAGNSQVKTVWFSLAFRLSMEVDLTHWLHKVAQLSPL